MEELSFKHYTLDDETMAHLSKCIHKVKRLDLSDCNISSNGVKQLSDAIMMLNEPVRIKITLDIQ